METIYGTVSESATYNSITDILNQTFKMLPYKEHNNPSFESHTTTLLFRIRGLSELFPNEPMWVTVLANLQAAKTEENFQVFRKTVLDACAMISEFQKQLGESNDAAI